jgi:PAS domain S-box-containing protein
MNLNTTKKAGSLRRRAERDPRMQDPPPLPRTEADALRLVHELEVHQIELEMQNIQLLHARDEAEAILEKYTDLYDFAPVGYFTLTADESIRLVNLTGSVLVGVERSKLIGRSFGVLLSREDRSRFRTFLQQAFASEGRQSAEFELAGSGMFSRVVNIEAQRSFHGSECNAVMVDITERKRAEETSSRSAELFSALISLAPAGVYVVDSSFRLQQANPIAMRVFENVHPLIGRDFSEVIRKIWPRRIADQIVGNFRWTLESGESFLSPPFHERRRDTRLKEDYEWQIQRVTLSTGEYGVVCFFSNITERVRAEAAQRRVDVLASSNLKLKEEMIRRQVVQEDLRAVRIEQSRLLKQSRLQQKQMRELSHRILEAQEDERERISRELHDVIAQTLVGINVHLAALSEASASDPVGLQTQISHTHLLVENAVEIVHNFARELRPTMLDDLGLIPALQTFMREFIAETGIRVSLKASAKVEQLTGAVRATLYRIVQEALTNVSRHAKASRAEVRIECLDDTISMVIRDNGQGFNTRGKKHNRLGLVGMRERVEMIGGSFGVESAAGESTTVHLEIPMGKNVARLRGKRDSEK